MRTRFGLRSSIAGLTVLAVGAAVLVFFAVGAFASGGTGCPSLSGKQASTDINAYFTDNGTGEATYFIDTPSDSPSGGVPGLIQYCVVTSPVPDSATADYASWTASTGTIDFAYQRNDGNPSNLPFDGSTGVQVGHADWSSGTVPDASAQTIILHINDPGECASLYGAGSSDTCWVFPNGTPTTSAADLTVSKTATTSYTRTYKWSISKSVDNSEVDTSSSPATFNYTVPVNQTGFADSGWEVTGTITVTNPNGFDVSGVNVSDVISNNADSCTPQDGTVEGIGGATGIDPASATIPANGAVDFPYTCTYSSAPDPTSGTNTATATWDNTTGPMLGTSGTANSGPVAFDFANATVTPVDQTVTPTDSFDGGTGVDLCTLDTTDTNPPCTLTASDDLSSLTSYTYHYSYDESGTAGTCTDHSNVASIGDVGSSKEVDTKVCVGADLSVSKNASAAFTRTYNWSIAKSVDKTTVTQAGGSATFNYTVNVKQTGFTDSGWKVTGTITVSNPNDWESVTLTGVSDSIDHSGNCSINTSDIANETATLNPKGQTGDSTTLGYTCTFSSNPGSGTNTATATWSASAAYTPDGTNSGTAGYDFSTATVTPVNKTITPTDAFNGGSGVKLCVLDTVDTTPPCTLTATDSTPYTAYTYHYSRTINVGSVPLGTCKTYDNTATIVETGQTSGKSVMVCNFNAPLTIGYWGNHLNKTGGTGCTGLPNGTGCNSNGPFTVTYLPQCVGSLNPFSLTAYNATACTPGYLVDTILKAAKVFAANNCSNASTSPSNATACLAAQLLGAELNVANKANYCIVTVKDGINDANKFLAGGTVDGVTGVVYPGPGVSINFGNSANQTKVRNEALVLQSKLVNYNQGGGC